MSAGSKDLANSMIWLGVGETEDYKGGWGWACGMGSAFVHIAAAGRGNRRNKLGPDKRLE